MKLILFANTEWYLWNFRRSLALALRDAGHEVLLISPDGPYGEQLRGLGLRWQPLPMDRRSLNPLRKARLLWPLVRALFKLALGGRGTRLILQNADDAVLFARAWPVIVTRFAGIKEKIDSGVNGLIVEQGVDAIVVGMRRLLENPGMRSRLAAGGYPNVLMDDGAKIDALLSLLVPPPAWSGVAR